MGRRQAPDAHLPLIVFAAQKGSLSVPPAWADGRRQTSSSCTIFMECMHQQGSVYGMQACTPLAHLQPCSHQTAGWQLICNVHMVQAWGWGHNASIPLQASPAC